MKTKVFPFHILACLPFPFVGILHEAWRSAGVDYISALLNLFKQVFFKRLYLNITRYLDEEDGMSEDEMVELPGGIDQLESIIEDHNKPEDNSKLIFSKHEKSGM